MKCAYCGKEAKGTKEHIISSGILGLFPECFATIDGERKVVHQGDPMVKDVCTDCNNNKISYIDSYAKAFIEKYFIRKYTKDEILKIEYDYSMIQKMCLKYAFNDLRSRKKDTSFFSEEIIGFLLNENETEPLRNVGGSKYMKYIGIGIVIAVAIAAGIIIYTKFNKREDIPSGDLVSVSSTLTSGKDELVEIHQENELIIQMEMLPVEAIDDETKLVEITDSKVLAHVNNLVPGLAQAGNAVNNAAQAVQAANGEVLYRAVIPAGAKLTNSKAMEGAVRGIYHGADGIKGHANLVAVEAQKGTAVVANTATAAMGVASMVVGQYYMTQINAELGEISDGISQIQDFQDNEYRSRVFSLVAHVKKIADFQTEILENDELRLSKIAQLDSLEEECTQLLGQANLTLAGFAKKTGLDYEAYEKALGNVY